MFLSCLFFYFPVMLTLFLHYGSDCVTTMEKPPFRQNQNCGDWELKERLGMGGFAHVYLYQHHVSLEPYNHQWHM